MRKARPISLTRVRDLTLGHTFNQASFSPDTRAECVQGASRKLEDAWGQPLAAWTPALVRPVMFHRALVSPPQQGFDRSMLGTLAGASSLRNFSSRF